MCKTIAISMAKGGVGKITTAINLGAALSNHGRRVLLIDNDPEGHMTKALGHVPANLKHTLAHILYAIIELGQPDYIEQSIISLSETLALIPANAKLAAVDQRLVSDKASASWLLQTAENTLAAEAVLRCLIQVVAGLKKISATSTHI